MKRYTTIATTMVLALLIASPALAGRGHGKGGKGRGMKMFKALDLTTDQKAQVIDLKAAMQKDQLAVREELKAKRAELRELWAADEPDEKAIMAKHQEMDPLRQQMRARSVTFRLQVRALLTDEQKAKLQTMIKQGKRGFGDGDGDGYGGRGRGRGKR